LRYFILIFIFCLSVSHADSTIEFGPTLLSGDYAHGRFVLIEERFHKGRIGAGLGYIAEQRVDTNGDLFHLDPNIFVSVQRYFHLGPAELGIGPAYFQNRNRALSRNLTIAASIGIDHKRWSIKFRHYSNAGSGPIECFDSDRPQGWDCHSNLGQDAVTIGYRF
jgi:hypothetical protein